MKLASLAFALLQGLVAARPEDTNNGQPKEIRSVDGLLEVTLDVGLVTTAALNRTAPGYNGGPVGPTLRARPGDTVRITLVNNLEPSPADEVEFSNFVLTPVVDDEARLVNQTLTVNRLSYPKGNIWTLDRDEYWGKSFQNLHFHGLMVDPTIDDSRVYIDGGGNEQVYEWTIPEDSPPRLGFYHNHVHGTATYSFLSGLYGFFVIEDSSEPDVTEQFLLLSESKNHPDGTPQDFVAVLMDFDWEHVTNGQLNPTMTFKKGEQVLFRAVNAGIEPAMTVSIEGHILLPVSYDGYPNPNPESVESVTMDGGVRADFVVKFETPGTYKFTRAGWNAGLEGPACLAAFNIPADKCISYDKETDVGTIVVLDEEVSSESDVSNEIPSISKESRSGNTPEMHPYLESLLEMPMMESRIITFDQTDHYPIFQLPYDGPAGPGEGVGMGVNGRVFNPHYFDGAIVGGTCEEWTVVSSASTAPIHSFHAHYVPFYVTSMNGVELDEADRFWRDTMVAGANFTATFCFPPRDDESYINVHCHMPIHQDIGAAMFYKLLPGGETEDPSLIEDPAIPEEETDSSGKSFKASLIGFVAVLYIAVMLV